VCCPCNISLKLNCAMSISRVDNLHLFLGSFFEQTRGQARRCGKLMRPHASIFSHQRLTCCSSNLERKNAVWFPCMWHIWCEIRFVWLIVVSTHSLCLTRVAHWQTMLHFSCQHCHSEKPVCKELGSVRQNVAVSIFFQFQWFVQCPDQGTTQCILVRDSCIWSSFMELTLLSTTGPVDASPIAHCHWRRLPRRAMVPLQNDQKCNTSCRCDDSHCNSLQFHETNADSSRRSVFQLSKERIAPRDLEPNLSQMLHSVLVHSELVIFICKQHKRCAAFGTVRLLSTGHSLLLSMTFLNALSWSISHAIVPLVSESSSCSESWELNC